MTILKEKLIELKACEEAIEWICDRTLEQAWNECECGDWMWWLIVETNSATKEQCVEFADFCTRNAEKWKVEAERTAEAAEAARAAYWAKRAAEAAELAEAAYWAKKAAYWAKKAAKRAAEAAYWASEAAKAARTAGRAAMAYKTELKAQADFLRTMFKPEDINI